MRLTRMLAFLTALLLFSGIIQAQQSTVTGKVTDSTGAPLPGVSIQVKGGGFSSLSGTDGSFAIIIPAANSRLVFSAIGFESQEVAAEAGAMQVTLRSTVLSLSDVTVVSIGYGTLDKREVTSAVTHLTSKDLNIFGGNGALNSIQGKVAGLSITNTAPSDPNSGPSIQLRGASSRNAGLGPLYVINGIPGGNIDNLNQNDIESIDVLKGGAASAIYGTRGSNGVIIITTKKGNSQPQAFYDVYGTIDVPTNRIDVLSREEFLEKGRGTDYGGNTDWFKAVSRDHAYQQKHTLQLSGGSQRTNYIVSFDYRNAKGLDLRSSKEEYGARLNLNHTSANNLYTVAVTIAPRQLKSNNASYNAFSQSLTLNPTLPIFDTANPAQYNYINVGFNGAYNPVEEMRTVLSGTEGKYLDWNASFRLNILRNL